MKKTTSSHTANNKPAQRTAFPTHSREKERLAYLSPALAQFKSVQEKMTLPACSHCIMLMIPVCPVGKMQWEGQESTSII